MKAKGHFKVLRMLGEGSNTVFFFFTLFFLLKAKRKKTVFDHTFKKIYIYNIYISNVSSEFSLGLVSVFVATSKVSTAYLKSFDLKTSQRPSLRHAEADFQNTHKPDTQHSISCTSILSSAVVSPMLKPFPAFRFVLQSRIPVGALWSSGLRLQ